ncbi:monocarboxylate transporter 10 isoform X2 [Nematostella vectensis]|uniref:monocarboxylate transporter 10 isoform X2 n=1 Tax=Nematostella vectensis TaxID=45351 RepID=UPI0020778477|nr:monocarboxylate transporter 10 isoform X2 [Nematostella vectensis]
MQSPLSFSAPSINMSMNVKKNLESRKKYVKKQLSQQEDICSSEFFDLLSESSGVGTLTFGPLLQYLLKTYGFSSTLRILSGVMTLLLAASLTYKRFESPLQFCTNQKKTFLDLTLWFNKAFITYTIAVTLFMLGYFFPYVHMVSHVVSFGIPTSDAALLIGYMSISSTISRIIFGRFLDHPCVNRLYMTQFAIVGFGITTTLCPIAREYGSFAVVMVMLGLFDGIYVVLITVLVMSIIGADKLNMALENLGPPVAGLVYDALLSYDTAFYISGATTTLSSLLMFLIPWLLPDTRNGNFKRDSVGNRIGSILNSLHTIEVSENRSAPASGSSSLSNCCNLLDFTNSEKSNFLELPRVQSQSSIATSKNTIYNRYMPRQGSVTKTLLSRQLRSGSPVHNVGLRNPGLMRGSLGMLRRDSAPALPHFNREEPGVSSTRRDSAPCTGLGLSQSPIALMSVCESPFRVMHRE